MFPSSLIRQSFDASWDFYRYAAAKLDDLHGEGYAKDHPELIAALLNASAQLYAGRSIGFDVLDGFNALRPD